MKRSIDLDELGQALPNLAPTAKRYRSLQRSTPLPSVMRQEFDLLKRDPLTVEVLMLNGSSEWSDTNGAWVYLHRFISAAAYEEWRIMQALCHRYIYDSLDSRANFPRLASNERFNMTPILTRAEQLIAGQEDNNAYFDGSSWDSEYRDLVLEPLYFKAIDNTNYDIYPASSIISCEEILEYNLVSRETRLISPPSFRPHGIHRPDAPIHMVRFDSETLRPEQFASNYCEIQNDRLQTRAKHLPRPPQIAVYYTVANSHFWNWQTEYLYTESTLIREQPQEQIRAYLSAYFDNWNDEDWDEDPMAVIERAPTWLMNHMTPDDRLRALSELTDLPFTPESFSEWLERWQIDDSNSIQESFLADEQLLSLELEQYRLQFTSLRS